MELDIQRSPHCNIKVQKQKGSKCTKCTLVVGTFLMVGFDVALFRFTLPLTLLTSLNEALSAAASILGWSSWTKLAIRVYLLLLIPCLVVTESYEAVCILVSKEVPQPQWLLKILALAVLGAPFYHIFVVIPCSWRALSRALTPSPKKKRT